MKLVRPKNREVIYFDYPEISEEEMIDGVYDYLEASKNDWDYDDFCEVLNVLRAYNKGFFKFEDVHDILSDEYPWAEWPWFQAVIFG